MVETRRRDPEVLCGAQKPVVEPAFADPLVLAIACAFHSSGRFEVVVAMLESTLVRELGLQAIQRTVAKVLRDMFPDTNLSGDAQW